jgi:hypothetical protein
MTSVDWADSSPSWLDRIAELECKANKVLSSVNSWKDEAQSLERLGRTYLTALKSFVGQIPSRFSEMGLAEAPECLQAALEDMANCHEVFLYSLQHTFVR